MWDHVGDQEMWRIQDILVPVSLIRLLPLGYALVCQCYSISQLPGVVIKPLPVGVIMILPVSMIALSPVSVIIIWEHIRQDVIAFVEYSLECRTAVLAYSINSGCKQPIGIHVSLHLFRCRRWPVPPLHSCSFISAMFVLGIFYVIANRSHLSCACEYTSAVEMCGFVLFTCTSDGDRHPLGSH